MTVTFCLSYPDIGSVIQSVMWMWAVSWIDGSVAVWRCIINTCSSGCVNYNIWTTHRLQNKQNKTKQTRGMASYCPNC